MITSKRIVQILRELPPVKLDIIDLAWKVTGKDGDLESDKVAFYAKEVEAAADQAKEYIEQTEQMVDSLKKLLN